MRVNRLAVLAGGILFVLGGCIQSGDPSTSPTAIQQVRTPPDPRLPETAAAPRVVVAVIDTGINVYHDWYQRESSLSDGVLAGFVNAGTGDPPARVEIEKVGPYWARMDLDNATWNSLEPRKLYYFEGTNILGISFATKTATARPVIDEAGHGSGTAGAVVKANPNAIIVLVESFGAAAEAWVAAQPWIDISSMSYGPPGSTPPPTHSFQTHVHTKAAWAKGKIPVGAADNSPALTPNDETAGPPWVVGIAGDDGATGCRTHRSGTFPDFTSDFTQTLPIHRDTERTRAMSGTSFATPKSAGIYSNALLQVRQAWNHTGGITDGALAISPDGKKLTNVGLRDAFNRTAVYFGTNPCTGNPGTFQPVNPVAPWVQMGWGHLEYDTANATAAHILGTKAAPAKPMGAVQFQEAMFRYRQELWARI